MVEKRMQSAEGSEVQDTDRYLVNEIPDLRPSRQQELDHTPDSITTGYDPYADTRVGIGSASGELKKLVRYNEGRHPSDGSHSTREAARDKKRITQSFCSVLDLSGYQQQQSVIAIGRLNLDHFGSQKRLEKVALGVIKVVVEWDRSRYLRQRTSLENLDEAMIPNRMLEDDQYSNLLEHHDVSRKDIYSISQLVKRELKKCGYFDLDSGILPVATDPD